METVEVLISLSIFVATVIVAAIWNRLFGRFIKRSTFLVRNDPTYYKFLRHAITALIYVVGISWAIYRIQSLKTIANSMLAGAGILAVTIGFASQHALSNIVSGLFIVIFRPFRVNDRIALRGEEVAGVIEDITLRHTVIRDFQNRRVVIPNAIISEEVIRNSDIIDEKINRWIEFDISYDSDIDLARKIMQEIILNHPAHIDGRSDEQKAENYPEVPVRVVGFSDSSVKIRAWSWSANLDDAFALYWDVIEAIKKRFDAEGIEIPFPYRTIVYKNDIDKANKQVP